MTTYDPDILPGAPNMPRTTPELNDKQIRTLKQSLHAMEKCDCAILFVDIGPHGIRVRAVNGGQTTMHEYTAGSGPYDIRRRAEIWNMRDMLKNASGALQYDPDTTAMLMGDASCETEPPGTVPNTAALTIDDLWQRHAIDAIPEHAAFVQTERKTLLTELTACRAVAQWFTICAEDGRITIGTRGDHDEYESRIHARHTGGNHTSTYGEYNHECLNRIMCGTVTLEYAKDKLCRTRHHADGACHTMIAAPRIEP